jgi:hypothetical protein
MLHHGVGWYLVTGISGQPTGHIFKGPKMSGTNNQAAPHNTSKE